MPTRVTGRCCKTGEGLAEGYQKHYKAEELDIRRKTKGMWFVQPREQKR